MDSMIFFWLGVSFFFLLLEMSSPGLFFFLSFFIGGLVSAFVALAITPLVGVQGAAFLASSLIAFFILHRWVKKGAHETAGHKTNVFTLQGKRGIVTKEIGPHESGLVKVRGEVWSARSGDNKAIAVNTKITVMQVRGVHLIVRKED